MMTFLRRMRGSLAPDVETALERFEELLRRCRSRGGKVTYAERKLMCSLTRQIGGDLYQRYLDDPQGDGLVTAYTQSDDNHWSKPEGEAVDPNSTIFGRARTALAHAEILLKGSSDYTEEQKPHADEMLSNVILRAKQLDIILDPKLTYSQKLDQVDAASLAVVAERGKWRKQNAHQPARLTA